MKLAFFIKIIPTNRRNRFEGIIHHLNNQCHRNSAEKGVIDVSIPDLPAIYKILSNYQNSSIVDFDSKTHYITVATTDSNWVKFDFKKKSVRPTNYSIRTWNLRPGNSHLMNWAIEGSNNNEDWKVLDKRTNEKSLDSMSAENTFGISTKLAENENFRYLRLKVTGPNSRNTNILFATAIEFFGELYSDE